jgi:hypothetical protein
MGLRDAIAVFEQDPKIRIVASKYCWCAHSKLQCAEATELFGVMLWAEHYLESTPQQ